MKTNVAARVRLLPLALLGTLSLAACDDEATGPDGFATDELTAELAITPDHFHILETEGTFTVVVTDPAGDAVTDFEVLRLERRLVGAATWSGMELTLQGDAYVGTYTFETSGNYELRVTGLRESDEDLVVLLTVETPLGVIRAHADVGGRRVEYETVPGHIHQGDRPTVTFWVMETARNAEGVRPPVGGLAPTLWVETNGVRVEYPAQETATGVYGAAHTFATVGDATVGIRVNGTDGNPVEWSVPVTVHAAH